MWITAKLDLKYILSVMLTPQQKSIISDTNALYLGVSVSTLTENAGKGIAKKIVEKYGKDKDIGILCGLGGNGADGLCSARHMVENGVKNVTVYLFGRSTDIKSKSTLQQWEKLKSLEKLQKDVRALVVKQDCFADSVENHDVFLECLVGMGIKSKDGNKPRLTKRFADVIKKIVRMDGKKVAVDFPVPGYNWDYSISMAYPKTSGAVVVDIGLPKEADLYTGPGEVKVLENPKKETHKTQNGKVLIIGGSDTYHGAPIMASMSASKLVGMVYFYSTLENRELVSNLKKGLLEVISVSDSELEKYADYADVFVIGPGLEDNLVNRALVRFLLEKYPEKKKVIDAGAIAMSPKSLLRNAILTPHRGELRYLFPDENSFLRNAKTGGEAVEGKIRRFTKESGSCVVLKGHVSLLFGPNGEFKMNKTGNPGMAKGGSGDVLSGLIGALATKNEPWLSMCAGAFINGMAGDLCYKEFGYNFSATDLIPKIQQVIKWAKEM
ncbi:NAD(P)H-hydrate dehydratase [Candidatus Dojkabacteria bacterium]|nr:NAD(P)H-hydrate dehydratase [Candidatus Dojkabacteria bacterium]